jgi:hypothetical protein
VDGVSKRIEEIMDLILAFQDGEYGLRETAELIVHGMEPPSAKFIEAHWNRVNLVNPNG